MTPLYIFTPNIIYFDQKEPINMQILSLSIVASKFAKFLMSFFKAQVSFSNIKHQTFTLEKNVSQSANFKIFECAGEVHQIPHESSKSS